MKRTKQRGDRTGQAIPEHVSGCRQFEGEDLLYHDRMMQNAKNINDWAQQKARENKAAADQSRDEDNAYAAQTDAILRMRGLLEDEATMKKNAMMKAMQEENKRLALEKRQREQFWKDDQACADKAEITLTNHHESLDNDGRITRQIEDRGRFHQV